MNTDRRHFAYTLERLRDIRFRLEGHKNQEIKGCHQVIDDIVGEMAGYLQWIEKED